MKTKNLNKKYSMPHLNLKNKGHADLYFEFLEPKDRKKFYDDLISEKTPKIELPNFGVINEELNINIYNQTKLISKDDLNQNAIDFLEKFTRDTRIPKRPLIQYNSDKHKFELKNKHNYEKILKEIIEEHSLVS